mmetsp:Transcript_1321/g.1783  ORF Transcript_1321/g.1783 Transcript_1321/m.1783 type:complete len:111 (-) Transcript_1321:138-470(-)
MVDVPPPPSDQLWHFACVNDLPRLKFLLGSEYSRVNEKSPESGDTPLTACIKEGHLDTAKFLISVKADIEARNDAGDTALTIVASKGDLKKVKYLVSIKANIEAKAMDRE